MTVKASSGGAQGLSIAMLLGSTAQVKIKLKRLYFIFLFTFVLLFWNFKTAPASNIHIQKSLWSNDTKMERDE